MERGCLPDHDMIAVFGSDLDLLCCRGKLGEQFGVELECQRAEEKEKMELDVNWKHSPVDDEL